MEQSEKTQEERLSTGFLCEGIAMKNNHKFHGILLFLL